MDQTRKTLEKFYEYAFKWAEIILIQLLFKWPHIFQIANRYVPKCEYVNASS